MVWAGALLAGAALGAVFFGGLWWTVQRAATSPTPARWFLVSLVARATFVLAGFYAVGAGQPAQMGLSLLGFLLARAVILRVTKPAPDAATTSGVPPCA
jgi:F1F0 ATPase subunit 2